MPDVNDLTGAQFDRVTNIFFMESSVFTSKQRQFEIVAKGQAAMSEILYQLVTPSLQTGLLVTQHGMV